MLAQLTHCLAMSPSVKSSSRQANPFVDIFTVRQLHKSTGADVFMNGGWTDVLIVMKTQISWTWNLDVIHGNVKLHMLHMHMHMACVSSDIIASLQVLACAVEPVEPIVQLSIAIGMTLWLKTGFKIPGHKKDIVDKCTEQVSYHHARMIVWVP